VLSVHRLLLVVLGLAGSVALWGRLLYAQPPTELPDPRSLEPRSDCTKLQMQGTASCAAAACHNSAALTGTHGREFALALQRDPSDQRALDRHADAYQTLFSSRSRQIEQRLRGLDSAAEARPETNALCLRCHVHPDFDKQASREIDGIRQFRLEDGVSCETCHGPAQHWRAEHFRPGWSALSVAERSARGMADTLAVQGRVRLCVDCHVGSRDMDVNHDLIAAGHPRLNFEFSSYHFFLHRHWDPSRNRAEPDFEERGWALGQLAAGRAALQLLAERAERRSAPWPELAEYDCFACHHDLRSPTWRQKPALARQRPGTPSWNTWYTAQLPAAIDALQGDPNVLGQVLGTLRKEMAAARPDRTEVARHARRAAHLVEEQLQRGERASLQPAETVFRRIVDQALQFNTWDDAAQTYLALSSFSRTGRLFAVSPELSFLRERLRFPDRFDSPRDFDPAQLEQSLQSLRKKLAP
jgi:hypothetical protein